MARDTRVIGLVDATLAGAVVHSANLLLCNPTIAYLTTDEIVGRFSRRSALSDGDAVPPSAFGIGEDVRSRTLDSLVHLDRYPVATRCVANLGDHVVQ